MASDDLHSDWAAWLDAELADAEAAALRAHHRARRHRFLRRALGWTAAVALAATLGLALVYTAQHGPTPVPVTTASAAP
ncbi:hypothetical protein AB0K51_30130 [Kitasatospora sp. NPDC049285]|uniref:hypothetical protein n=1 Tax=Kitasatospora sp. NPDC049285 TaxID=3157096 RepID=UPI00341C0363